jgi:hypothetical protein
MAVNTIRTHNIKSTNLTNLKPLLLKYEIWFIIQILLINVKYIDLLKRKHDFPEILVYIYI